MLTNPRGRCGDGAGGLQCPVLQVVAGGGALHLALRGVAGVVQRRLAGDQGEAAGEAAARIRAARRRRQRDRLVAPMHQVGAARVAPVDVAPLRGVRVVLVVEVVATGVEAQAVGIVDPVRRGGEVKARAVQVGGHVAVSESAGRLVRAVEGAVCRSPVVVYTGGDGRVGQTRISWENRDCYD